MNKQVFLTTSSVEYIEELIALKKEQTGKEYSFDDILNYLIGLGYSYFMYRYDTQAIGETATDFKDHIVL